MANKDDEMITRRTTMVMRRVMKMRVRMRMRMVMRMVMKVMKVVKMNSSEKSRRLGFLRVIWLAWHPG